MERLDSFPTRALLKFFTNSGTDRPGVILYKMFPVFYILKPNRSAEIRIISYGGLNWTAGYYNFEMVSNFVKPVVGIEYIF